jgi:hypothetical protein
MRIDCLESVLPGPTKNAALRGARERQAAMQPLPPVEPLRLPRDKSAFVSFLPATAVSSLQRMLWLWRRRVLRDPGKTQKDHRHVSGAK